MSVGGPAPGDRIGDWVVEARLGSGGMGTVFRCHNALTTRIRAAVVYWYDANAELATHIQTLIGKRGYAEPTSAIGESVTDIDFAIWLLGPE